MTPQEQNQNGEFSTTSPHEKSAAATEVFRIPSADATAPDLFNQSKVTSPTLTIIKGPQTGAVFELDSPVITLGRDPKNSVFLNDMTVSRAHARIDMSSQETGLVQIEDLGSLNGTWVDGTIVARGVIKDGSIIQIGTFKMVFHTTFAQRLHADL